MTETNRNSSRHAMTIEVPHLVAQQHNIQTHAPEDQADRLPSKHQWGLHAHVCLCPLSTLHHCFALSQTFLFSFPHWPWYLLPVFTFCLWRKRRKIFQHYSPSFVNMPACPLPHHSHDFSLAKLEAVNFLEKSALLYSKNTFMKSKFHIREPLFLFKSSYC